MVKPRAEISMRGRYRFHRFPRAAAIVGGLVSFVFVPLVQGTPARAADSPASSGAYPACGAHTPSPDDVAAAKKTFELGNRYMSEADYDRAIAYFRDAYRSDCTAHKLLVFVARANEL